MRVDFPVSPVPIRGRCLYWSFECYEVDIGDPRRIIEKTLSGGKDLGIVTFGGVKLHVFNEEHRILITQG